MKKWNKSLLVGVGALVFSTVSIQASDVLRGIEGGLSGLVIESEGVCGEGAVQMLLGSHALCIDEFEASAGSACQHVSPQNLLETQENANIASCIPESKREAMPWRFVSFTQAQQLCARDGKRLPTNEEWYKIASGITNSDSCAIDLKNDEPALTGTTECKTPAGAHDMVGNVWEWIDGQVTDGVFEGRTVPESGFVTLVDRDGVVVETSAVASKEFGEDYALTSNAGVSGIIRGGFYKSGTDAGIFSQNLSVPLDLKTAGVGFRCVKDV